MFLASLAILMVGVANELNRHTAQRLVSLIIMFGFLLAVFGIAQNRLFDGEIYGFWSLTQGGTPFGPFINRNHFAGWMLVAIPLSLGQFMSRLSRRPNGKPSSSSALLWLLSEDGSKVTLSAFALLVMSLSVALTMSRSGVAALALSLSLGIIVMGRRLSPAPGARLMYGYLVLIVIGVIAWGSVDRIASRFASVGFAAMNERPAMWADSLSMARDFWLTGAGLNTFGAGMIFYQTSIPDFHLRAAHNDYLQLMAEGGVLLCVPIALVFVAFVHALRQRSSQDIGSVWWIRAGAVLGLVSIGLQSIVEFSLQLPGNAVLFAVIAGIALHDGRHRHAVHSRLPARSPHERSA
jgi:O-antigen ligase